jgi:Uma2 family endonuclease
LTTILLPFKIFNRAYVTAAPDLILAALSPSTRMIELKRKFDLSARMGVPEYWVADPEKRTLTIFVLSAGGYVPVKPSDGCLHSTVLADLVIDPVTVFGDLPLEEPA